MNAIRLFRCNTPYVYVCLPPFYSLPNRRTHMKMNRIGCALIACTCLFGAADALAADTVAVMKLDVLGEQLDMEASLVSDALRDAVMKDDNLILDANGGDITYTEMQMVTGCEKDASIQCYDTACETLGAPAIIFGSVKNGGEVHLVWYVSGKGIFREATGTVKDHDSAVALASELVVGEKGKLIVTSNVPGADVFIDGKRIGMSAEFEENATPIELVTGKYLVSVRKDGFTKEDSVNVIIEGGKTSTVRIEMAVATDPEVIRRGVLIGGYTSLGVGVASMIVGTVLPFISKSKGEGNVDDKIDAGSNFKASDVSLAKNLKIASYATLGVGGFFVAAGIAMIVTGYVYDFAGEDIDKGLAANPYVPKIDFDMSKEYKGVNFGWTF